MGEGWSRGEGWDWDGIWIRFRWGRDWVVVGLGLGRIWGDRGWPLDEVWIGLGLGLEWTL